MSPLWPQPDTDPSHLEQIDYQNPDDPQPGPSGFKAAACQDSDDLQPGSSDLEPAAHSDPEDPQPGPSGLKPTPETDLADPMPAKCESTVIFTPVHVYNVYFSLVNFFFFSPDVLYNVAF